MEDKSHSTYRKCYGPEVWFVWFTVIVLFVVAGMLIASFIIIGDSQSTTNYSIFADKVAVPSSIQNDLTGFMRGHLKMNQNLKSIKWAFIYDKLNMVISMYVMGPIGQTSTETGPVAVTLCGPPSTLACDLSVPRKINGEIHSKMPDRDTLRGAITEIRKAPAFYKFCVITAQGTQICSNLIP